MALEQHSGFQIKDTNGNVAIELDEAGNFKIYDASGNPMIIIDRKGHIRLKGRLMKIT